MFQTNQPSSLEEINLHLQAYRSALKTSQEIAINSLVETYQAINPILHSRCRSLEELDIPAFIYSLLRLPDCVEKAKLFVLGQSPDVFAKTEYKKIESWQRVYAPSRRRTTYFDNREVVGVFITSISDIDDLINTLIAFQIEWNKFHRLLKSTFSSSEEAINKIKRKESLVRFGINDKDWSRLISTWQGKYKAKISALYEKELNLKVKLLAGSWIDYTKVVQKWWKNISATLKPEIRISHQPIYFVSSNTHGLLNISTSFVRKHKELILAFIKSKKPNLYQYWQEIKKGKLNIDEDDFFYFASKEFLRENSSFLKRKEEFEKRFGIRRVPALHYLDSETHVFSLSRLTKSDLDKRIKIKNSKKLSQSQAFILNIDYPLGFAAYHVLEEVLENEIEVRGVYIIGKAATLNGHIGDIIIPKIIYDEHSQNSYLIKNCFNNNFPHPRFSSVLDNQKAVSVLGTFLQNQKLIDTYLQNGITIVEMENGPYLSAVTEATYPQKYPQKTIVDLSNPPFDLGIINYASDTPYSKVKNMGIRSLEIDGVEPVYLSSIAVLQRIIEQEENR